MAEVRIGLCGTGFIARNFTREVARRDDHRIERILTRRPPATVTGFPDGVLTSSIDDLVSHADVIVECSGDPWWAREVVTAAVSARVPVVTMNTEFHITFGSEFADTGLVTEAAGDQPGCLAELHEEAVAMGFTPIAYGNMKGFLNPDPTPEEMAHWAKVQGISQAMTTSFTDGTKVQAEQVLVGNFFGATIAQEGMLGARVEDLREASEVLAKAYEQVGRPITDFVVSPNLSHGVFIVATHDEHQKDTLRYYKLGDGPYYTLVRPNIFVHLEILKTVRRMLTEGRVLLTNSARPELSLGAVAKRDLQVGEVIENGIGSFDVRGYALVTGDHPGHVPIGLIQTSTVLRPVKQGSVLTAEEIGLDEARWGAWKSTSVDPSSSEGSGR